MDLWRGGLQEAALLRGARHEEAKVLLPAQAGRPHRRPQQKVSPAATNTRLALYLPVDERPPVCFFAAALTSGVAATAPNSMISKPLSFPLFCESAAPAFGCGSLPRTGAFVFFFAHTHALILPASRQFCSVNFLADPHNSQQSTTLTALFFFFLFEGVRCPTVRYGRTTAMTEKRLAFAHSTEPRACTTSAAGGARCVIFV